MASNPGGDGQKVASSGDKKTKSRIKRVDQVYDIQTSQVRLIPSVKHKIKSRRNHLMTVRRLIDEKGLYTSTEVDITSIRLANALQELNPDVSGVSLRANPPVVPLELFFHNRLALEAKLEECRNTVPIDEDLVRDLTEASEFAKTEHSETAANVESLLAAGEITWDLLWTIFPPNVLVHHYCGFVEEARIMKLRAIEQERRSGGSKYWELECIIVADDGTKFGIANDRFTMEIDEFVGVRKIADLSVFPLDFHPEAEQIRQTALERGRRYAGLTERRVMQTSGPAIFEKRDDRWEPHPYKFTSHGRAIVDPVGFRFFNPNINFAPFVQRVLDREGLSDELLMMCTPIVLGFSFGDNAWGGFAMSRLEDVTWDDKAIDQIVLEEQTKMLIHCMVRQHSLQDTGFDDIIHDKGKGMVMLFTGPPGCGKTSTAEAISEITRRPLYCVSAGHLGVDPQTVDRELTQTLEQAQKWNAILLLDEADVFLQQRDQHNVKRNALVSIFLRHLEYFQGVLILTTNRVAQCDIAFESRIHILIPYHELDEFKRTRVWELFLTKAKGVQNDVTVEISNAEVSELAKIQVNGRQIKNIVSGARSIARERKETLDCSKIYTVLSATSVRPKEECVVLNGINGKGSLH